MAALRACNVGAKLNVGNDIVCDKRYSKKYSFKGNIFVE
jgi:hypothetical protein